MNHLSVLHYLARTVSAELPSQDMQFPLHLLTCLCFSHEQIAASDGAEPLTLKPRAFKRSLLVPLTLTREGPARANSVAVRGKARPNKSKDKLRMFILFSSLAARRQVRLLCCRSGCSICCDAPVCGHQQAMDQPFRSTHLVQPSWGRIGSRSPRLVTDPLRLP